MARSPDKPGEAATHRSGLPSVPDALSTLGISGRVTTKDSFSIEYASGLMVATVRKKSGVVQTARRSVDGSFQEVTTFDPRAVSKEVRNDLIRRLARDGMTQSEVARRTGVSQATVSNVLRK